MTKIYIPHYTKLHERYTQICSTCNLLPYDYEIISSYDKEDLPIANKNNNQKEWEKRIELIKPILLINAGIGIRQQSELAWLKYRKLKKAEVSLTYKHLIALLKIASSRETGVVFEDDVGIKENSLLELKQAIDLVEQGVDYIDLAGGCSLPIYPNDEPLNKAKKIMLTNPPRSRTTAGYVVNPNAAEKLAKNLFPAILPLDWSFQYIFLSEKLRVCWSNPPAFIHGSQGLSQSSIQNNE